MESVVVRFGNFEFDTESCELRRAGHPIKLALQPARVLCFLIGRSGTLVSRQEIRDYLWGQETLVDTELGLNYCLNAIRSALHDSPRTPRFIETLPKRGYRFIADVYVLPSATMGPGKIRARLAVLPFANLNGDSAQEYFADAMTDEIITALATLAPPQLAVIARTTAMHYKGSHKDVGRIGRELGVDYIVEGALRSDKDQIAINVQLIQTRDQAHLFARRYEAQLRDIFNLQSSIAEDIATHVHAPDFAEELHGWVHSRRKPTENLAAYNEYIQGKYLAERLTPDAMAGAKQHFEEAIKADPEFALAHIAIADLYSWLGYLGYMRPRDAYSIGIRFALRAAGIDDTLPEAHAVLAQYHKQLDYNWPAAEREMTRALELSRASPFVRLRHAVMVLMPQNRMEEAVAEIRCALESDPLAAGTRFWLGIMLLLAREYDLAIDEARKLLALEPNSPWPPYITGVAYRQKYYEGFVQTKMLDTSTAADFAEKAIAGHKKAIELSPASDVLLGWLGLALGVCGRNAEARALLEQLQRSERYILPTSFAHVYYGLGELDRAFEWFDRAVDERDQIMMPILSYAHFDPMRRDPRFTALLCRMNLKA